MVIIKMKNSVEDNSDGKVLDAVIILPVHFNSFFFQH